MEGVPAPQNFIPGTTKPKFNSAPHLHKTEDEEEVCEICYQGVHIKLSKTRSVQERALLCAGLKAMTIGAPMNHAQCKKKEHSVTDVKKNGFRKNRSKTFNPPSDRTAYSSPQLPDKIAKMGFNKWRSLDSVDLKELNTEI